MIFGLSSIKITVLSIHIILYVDKLLILKLATHGNATVMEKNLKEKIR